MAYSATMHHLLMLLLLAWTIDPFTVMRVWNIIDLVLVTGW